MKIQILSVEVKTVPTAKGSYQMADIAFKNLTYQGKVEGKKCMSFGAGAAAFKILSVAQPSSVFEITVVKNPAGFNDWTEATPSTEGATSPQPPSGASYPSYAPKAASVAPATRSTYESAEERAQKQVLIVRQSTLSNAINTLGAGAKSPPKVEDILALARQYEAHVFGVSTEKPDEGFDSFPDDSEVL